MTHDWKPQVYLVGAGPGDPGLFTRRGEALLNRADIVFHDALIHPGLLALIPPDTEKVPVGKRAGGIGPKQDAINDRLVAAAREGKLVVRLKGGDPFVFGRGGEEMLALSEAGIRFEIVPGVTSASAVPAMIGIPLTVRGISSVVHIVTGHVDPADDAGPVDWDLLTQPGHTVVVLMGSARLIEILKRLRANGMDESTPLAVIHWGTLPAQRSLRGTLGDALANPDRFTLPSPALAVIGGVAGMHEGLNWFERRPLFGRRVMLTRPTGQEAEMLGALLDAGADAENTPLIRFNPDDRDSDEHLIDCIEELRHAGGWLILPSNNAIESLFHSLQRLGLDARAMSGIRIAVLGRRAARVLSRYGLRADFVPDQPLGARLAQTLPLPPENPLAVVGGSRISRPELRASLEKRGFRTAHLVLYGTQADETGTARLAERLGAGEADDVVFTSPSGVEALSAALGPEMPEQSQQVRFWAIGPTTAEALRQAGCALAGEAASPTPDGVIEMLMSAGSSVDSARSPTAAGSPARTK